MAHCHPAASLARGALRGSSGAAVLIFAGVLTPALGFFNLYMFCFSFVADHYQYHASIALMALAAATAVLAAGRLAEPARRFAPVVGAGLLLPLALVAQHKTHAYKDDQALAEDVLMHDPQCWLVHHSYARLLQRAGNYAAAMSHFRKELESREQLARDNPAKNIHQNAVAANLVDIGQLQREMGWPAEAECSFHRSIEIRDKLVRDHPTVADHQAALAWSYVHCALAQQHGGRAAEAAVSCRRSIEIREKLAGDNPTIGDYQDQVAASYVDFGVLQREMGWRAEAAASFQKAVVIRKKLVRDHPLVTGYRAGLGWSYAKLGIAELASGRPAKAEASHAQAIAIREKLVQDNPMRADFQQELALSYRDRGDAQCASGRLLDAIASYRAAIAKGEQLAAAYPTDAAIQSQLASDLARCGDAHAVLGKWRESADAYGKAVQASNGSCQMTCPFALAQLAAGNEAGYRATCEAFVARCGNNIASDALLSTALTLVAGKKALADMNPALAVAKRSANQDPSNPVAAILAGAAEYRAGHAKEAIAALSAALSQLDSSAPSPAASSGQTLVGRLLGAMVLALAYREQPDDPALQKQLQTLRELIDTTELPGSDNPVGLPQWALGFAVEIAKRELAKLSVQSEASSKAPN